MNSDAQPPRLIDKFSGVLRILADGGQASAAEIAEVLGEPRSSVHRLLSQLESVGWVERSSSRGQWLLGLELFRLGTLAVEGRDVRGQAGPHMQRVHEATNETVFLFVRRGLQAVCIDSIYGRYVRSLAIGLGGVIELHAGAGPRCLLAFGSPDVRHEWRQWATGEPLNPRTSHASTSIEAIETELERVRDQGYAISDQDVTIGIAAVGVPIFGFDGELVAALSVSGIRDVVLDPDRKVTEVLIQAGQDLSHELGYRPAGPV